MTPQEISDIINRQLDPRFFTWHDRKLHVALLAFPHTSQTLCHLPLAQLDYVDGRPELMAALTGANDPRPLFVSDLCQTCVCRIVELVVRYMERLEP
jgi:hypothetical protein